MADGNGISLTRPAEPQDAAKKTKNSKNSEKKRSRVVTV
jgi:hypothetical protein